MLLGVLQFYIQQDKLGAVGLKTGINLDQKEGQDLPLLPLMKSRECGL